MDDIVFVDENGRPIDFSKYSNPKGPTKPEDVKVEKSDSWLKNIAKSVADEARNPKKLAKGMGETVVDMVTHPTETAFDLGVMGSLAGFGKGFVLPLGLSFAGVNDMLRKGDENIAKFGTQILHHPSDLYHLIKGATMDWFDYENPRGE